MSPVQSLCLVCLVSYFIARSSPQKSIGARREQVPLSMAIENGELRYECFPKHFRMGTARLKQDNETEEESKKRRINEESSSHVSRLSTLVTTDRLELRQSDSPSTVYWRYSGV